MTTSNLILYNLTSKSHLITVSLQNVMNREKPTPSQASIIAG
jgi:hypothetical protein